ncbi:AAA family ATPase [Kitasatospora sp. NPDC048540]|uniref:helix-turn-helix transcriptional regulator n=1 Tax=unclassified Kitasatospora TaxID=2633591 RepID=UPI0011EA631A|nr:LuxR family transcriptional regulator [Kitasatospora sp. MBT63]
MAVISSDTEGTTQTRAGPAAGGSFVGRAAELAVLARYAAQAEQGTPGLVLVEGEAGIGKTALVRQALDHLDGFSTWWALCDPSEQDWAFGAVGQWLLRADRDTLERFEVLSRPLGPTTAPSAVGAELIELIDQAQSDGPVLLAVDDAQWADEESLRALRFLLRRLWADRVLVVVTARTSPLTAAGPTDVLSEQDVQEWRHLESGIANTHVLRLSGLPENDVRTLAGPGAEARPDLAHRLWRHTDGHPLHLLSLLESVTPADLADPDRPLPVPTSLSSAICRTLDTLPPRSRALAEVLAVLDARVPLVLAGRFAEIDDVAEALEPLLECGLAGWSPGEPSTPVHLNHQLQRDAIYQAMTPQRRRTLHTAAAPLVGADAAWSHRVAACDTTDPALALELEQESRRQAGDGQLARAATLLRWAADLSDTRELHEDRLLSAATHMNNVFNRNGLKGASQLREAVEHCAPTARRTMLQCCYAQQTGDYGTALQLGILAVTQAREEGDRETETIATIRQSVAAFHAGEQARAAELMRQADLATQGTSVLVRWLLGIALMFTEGPRAALREPWLAALPEDPAETALTDTVLLVNRGFCHLALGQLREAARDFSAMLAPARSDATAPLSLSHAHSNLAVCQYLLGDWRAAAVQAELAYTEAELAAFGTQEAAGHGWAAIVAAGQGRWESAREHCRAIAGRPTLPVFADSHSLGLAAIAQAQADPAAMYEALLPALALVQSDGGVWPTHQFWPMWAEALTGTGRIDQAREALERLREQSRQIEFLRPITAFTAGRIAFVEGNPEAAAAAYDEVLARPFGPDYPPLHLARLEHAAGTLHLRQGDRQRALRLIDSARDRLQGLGAAPFLARLEPDHRALGTTTAPEPAGAATRLTDREMDIARCAAQGLTNREIAQQLFVSVKTVEYHLGHVFAKLDLSSRRQLQRRLAEVVPEHV